MTNPIDTCLSDGPFGNLQLSNDFQVASAFVSSNDITLTFKPSLQYFQAPINIIALVELRNSTEDIIQNLDFEVDENSKLRFQYIELEKGKFQITLRIGEFSSPDSESIFSFKLKVPEFREEMKCCTINVDCISSGFGFVYNYFKINANIPEVITEEPEKVAIPPLAPLAVENILSARSFYNFYISNYEKLILFRDPEARAENLDSEIINENMLPNINILSLLYENNKNINKNFFLDQTQNFEIDLLSGSFGDFSSNNNFPLLNLCSLGGLIDGKKNINIPTNTNITDKLSSNSYFEELSEDIFSIFQNNNGPQIISNSPYQTSKIYLFNSQYEKTIYPKINNVKNTFPMYTQISVDNELVRNIEYIIDNNNDPRIQEANRKKFSKKQFFVDSILKRKFNKYLEDIKLLDYFYYCLVTSIHIKPVEIISTIMNTDSKSSTIRSSEKESTTESSVASESIFIRKFFGIEAKDAYLKLNNTFYIGDFDYIEQGAFSNNRKNSQLKSLLRDVKFIKEFLVDQVLIYRIDKWRADDPNINIIKEYDVGETIDRNNIPEPLESYYIINNFENQFLELIDSQVKYEKEYEYRVYKYFTELSNNNIVIKREFVESIKTKITDDPPVVPNVRVISYKNIDDKILMLISPNSGRYIDVPISIYQGDNDKINQLLSSSNRNDGKIQFESDDLINRYQLMKIEDKPSNYSDFSNSDLLFADASPNGTIGFIDTIEPNKKYYYCIRSIDNHDNFSNPTAPIEVELINESGAIYLRTKIIDFSEMKFNPTKELNKYLKIKPSNKQLLTSNTENSSFDVVNLKLGPKNKIWNKDYVLRLTSKITGKKIDIKFKFLYSLKNLNS